MPKSSPKARCAAKAIWTATGGWTFWTSTRLSAATTDWLQTRFKIKGADCASPPFPFSKSLYCNEASPASWDTGRWEEGWLTFLEPAATYSSVSWDKVPLAGKGFTFEFGKGSSVSPAQEPPARRMSDLFEEGNPMKGVKRHNHTERTRQSGY